jgi:hypothetical protein
VSFIHLLPVICHVMSCHVMSCHAMSCHVIATYSYSRVALSQNNPWWSQGNGRYVNKRRKFLPSQFFVLAQCTKSTTIARACLVRLLICSFYSLSDQRLVQQRSLTWESEVDPKLNTSYSGEQFGGWQVLANFRQSETSHCLVGRMKT